MLTLLAHGNDEQKDKYLKPLINGDVRICFSMTEQAAGADATGMRTTAVQDGAEWVINGEKWFTSMARISHLALVMARTDPEAPRHLQYSTFMVDCPTPGSRWCATSRLWVRRCSTTTPTPNRGGHAEVRIENLRVPAANLVGGRGQGFAMGQHRLGYGRLRHGMLSIAKAQAALDLAVGRAIERSTFGERLADRQGIQWMLASCAEKLYLSRLMVLHIAYKMENGLDLGQENSIAKTYIAHMLHEVIDTAIQLHGALGITTDLPLAEWYAEVRAQRLFDGPDEVHKWGMGCNVVKAFERDGTTASAVGGDLL